MKYISPVGKVAVPLLMIFAFSFPAMLRARCYMPLTGMPAYFLGLPSTFLAEPISRWIIPFGTMLQSYALGLLFIILSTVNIYLLAAACHLAWPFLAKRPKKK